MDVDFQAALDRFVAGAQAMIDAQYRDPAFRPTLLVDPRGKRYIRLYTQVGGDKTRRIAWGFVIAEDVVTRDFNFVRGDVAKSDGWKAPAPHARGNIFDADNGLGNVTWLGPAYLRG